MKICRVIGNVVATVKHSAYEGQKLMIVQPVDPQKPSDAPSFLAVDRVQSGAGDLVLVMQEGNGMRQLFGVQALPIRSIIVGHIDQMDVADSL